MWEIGKEFGFSAGHWLPSVPDGHPCKRQHGHNYTVKFLFRARELDEHGFVVDYNELDAVKQWLDDTFDHRNLNSCAVNSVAENPTAEVIARAIYELAPFPFPVKRSMYGMPQRVHLMAVIVKETDKTFAAYSEWEGMR